MFKKIKVKGQKVVDVEKNTSQQEDENPNQQENEQVDIQVTKLQNASKKIQKRENKSIHGINIQDMAADKEIKKEKQLCDFVGLIDKKYIKQTQNINSDQQMEEVVKHKLLKEKLEAQKRKDSETQTQDNKQSENLSDKYLKMSKYYSIAENLRKQNQTHKVGEVTTVWQTGLIEQVNSKEQKADIIYRQEELKRKIILEDLQPENILEEKLRILGQKKLTLKEKEKEEKDFKSFENKFYKKGRQYRQEKQLGNTYKQFIEENSKQ